MELPVKNLTLRARIFISMLLLILLSFLVTGGFSIIHFKKENAEYHRDRLARKEHAINSSINYMFQDYSYYLTDENIIELFEYKIGQLSKIHNLTVSIYNLNGQLLIKAGDLDVQKLIPASIRSQLQVAGGRETIESKDVFGEDMLHMYSLVHDGSGSPFAIIYLPYQDVKKMQSQDLWEFLEVLFEIYALLFLGAAFLAFFLSQYISNSLKRVSEMLKLVRLNSKNEPIQWNTKDEIGDLVTEYNLMLLELEKSAIKLAQVERDSAWKEMGKLVAHEIKNPLTPMRLNVQHLSKTLPTTNPQKLSEFTESMLDQIDTLVSITDSFSRFANLPTQRLEPLDLIALCKRAIDLHQNTAIDLAYPNGLKFQILADKEQMIRVLNNLITNAQQAIPEGVDPKISIEIFCPNEDAIGLTIRDNGIGIPESQLETIFEPSFTTKTKGMGLGLAIVRNILQGIQASIEVVSEPQKGAAFTITFKKHIE
jgi:two-component system nitrogen regulation sensor histidine kinase NtrY